MLRQIVSKCFRQNLLSMPFRVYHATLESPTQQLSSIVDDQLDRILNLLENSSGRVTSSSDSFLTFKEIESKLSLSEREHLEKLPRGWADVFSFGSKAHYVALARNLAGDCGLVRVADSNTNSNDGKTNPIDLSPTLKEELLQKIPSDRFISLKDTEVSLSQSSRESLQKLFSRQKNPIIRLAHFCSAFPEHFAVTHSLQFVTLRSPIPFEWNGMAQSSSQQFPLYAPLPPNSFDLLDIPPPPPSPSAKDASVTNSIHSASTHKNSTAPLDFRDFLPFFPTFFVPMSDVMKQLPEGYTSHHIEQLFEPTKTLQVITFGEAEKYVRVHGFYGRFSIAECAESNHRFAHYAPPPSLAPQFLSTFSRPGEWKAVPDLLSQCPASLIEQIPFGPDRALLYFAQQQHLFGFKPDGPGRITPILSSSLLPESTPTPLALNAVMFHTKSIPLSTDELLRSKLTEDERIDLQSQFPSWASFCAAHPTCIRLDSETGLVMHTRTYQREYVRRSSFTEQLEIAYRQNDKKAVRRLRRKLEQQRNPDNPLLERTTLLRSIHKFLPEEGHVSMVSLVRSLPQDVVSLLPTTRTKFFSNPEYFTLFEYQRPNNFHVQRSGLPLPSGALRNDYSEQELVTMVARLLQKGKPTQNTEAILIFLPRGARAQVKKGFGSLRELALRHPKVFAVVAREEEIAGGSIFLTLVGLPEEA